jgi:hypothetical protein
MALQVQPMVEQVEREAPSQEHLMELVVEEQEILVGLVEVLIQE